MERYLFSIKEFCLVITAMAIFVLLCIAVFFGVTDWDYFNRDQVENVFHIESLNILNEFPVSDQSLEKVLKGETVDHISSKIDTDTPFKVFRRTNQFYEQAETALKLDEHAKRTNVGKTYVVYLDIPTAELKKLNEPQLFFEGNWDPYSIYYNGVLIGKRQTQISNVPMPLTIKASDKGLDRITLVFQSTFEGKLAGVLLGQYTSIRDTRSVSALLRKIPIRHHIANIVSSLVFIGIGVFALCIAVVTPGFLDIWGLCAFSFSLAVMSWARLPMYYTQVTSTYSTVVGMFLVHLIAACVMTLGFFRVEGRSVNLANILIFRKWKQPKSTLILLVLITMVSIAGVFYFSGETESFAFQKSLNFLGVVYGMSQVLAIGLGFKSLLKAKLRFQTAELLPQSLIMKQRLRIAAIYSLCMITDVLWQALTIRYAWTISAGNWIIMISTLPAVAMMLMLYLMFLSSQRFHKRYAPKLNQIDYEVLTLGQKALEKRYFGALAAFDLVGTKKLNKLLLDNPHSANFLPRFFNLVEHDLASIFKKGVTFKYKSNGDEFIFVMWAKNESEAKEVLKTLFTGWKLHGLRLVSKWKHDFAMICKSIPDIGSVENLSADIDMHVMMSTLNNIRITMKGGDSNSDVHPDFLDARFTALSANFKGSNSTKIAVFADDAEMLGEGERYTATGDSNLGYLDITSDG